MGLPFEMYEGLALAGFKGEPYRAGAQVGVHEVNFVCRVAGDLVIAPEYSQLFVTMPEVLKVLKLALDKLGERKGARKPLLEELIDLAFAEETETEALAKQLRDLVGKKKAKTVCAGPIRRNLRFTRLAR